jgi:tetratricopeptide (TPR) repeat protein
MRAAWLVLVLASQAAHAQPRANEDPQRAEARQHYEVGAAAYEKGNFTVAAEEFLQAWRISHNAVVLFDLARAETRLGHEEHAIQYLRQYLDEAPDAVDAVAVRNEIEAREKALQAQKARAEAEAALKSAERERARAEEERSSERAQRLAAVGAVRRRNYLIGVSLLGGGVVVCLTGLAAGIVATLDAQTVASGGATKPGGTPVPFSGMYSRTADAGTAASRAGIALDVIGGALVVTGTVLGIWYSPKRRSWRWSLAPTPGGAVVGGVF